MRALIILALSLFLMPITVHANELFEENQAGRVEIINVSGNGSSSGSALDAVLRNLTSKPLTLNVHLRQPIYFRNHGKNQNMIATQVYLENGEYQTRGSRSFVTLPANKEVRVSMIAYCADFEKDNPSHFDGFTASTLPLNLQRAANKIAAYEAANPGQDLTVPSQLALWLSQGLSAAEIQQQFSFTERDHTMALQILR